MVPNAGHLGVADLERDFNVTVVTQNVDNPVSYTHLDVYKRQVQHRMLNQIHVGHHYKVGLVVQFYIHACVKSACEEVELQMCIRDRGLSVSSLLLNAHFPSSNSELSKSYSVYVPSALNVRLPKYSHSSLGA